MDAKRNGKRNYSEFKYAVQIYWFVFISLALALTITSWMDDQVLSGVLNSNSYLKGGV